MTTDQNRDIFLRGGSALGWCLTLALLATITTAAEPTRTDKEIKEPGIPPARTPDLKPAELTEVWIWNISNQPFKYRLARSTGAKWTDEITLEPGKYQSIRIPKPGQPSELEGTTIQKGSSYEGRFIGVRYPKWGGFMEVNLEIEEGETPIPNWFHVIDTNGYSEMISAPNIETARTRQAELQRQKPLTPQQIEKLKFTLRANWEFYDK